MGPGHLFSYACDAQGRLATMAGAPGTFAYAYAGNSATFDTLGRLTEVTHSRPGQAPAATVAGFA